jgi:heme o synthase
MDTTVSGEVQSGAVPWRARVRAFHELTKPRIATMVLLTIAAAAVVAAGGAPGVFAVLNVALGMFFVAASGNATNMYLERYTDFLMPRTAGRPLPDQRLKASEVAGFAAITLGIGLGFLLATTRPAVFLVAAGTWLLYVLVYTPLKTRTVWNTEVGAIAGALPVLAGSLAGGSTLSVADWSFFALLVGWQFPHFMAIAWLYRDDYAAGGLKMITVVEPTGRAAGRKAIAWALFTLVISLGPLLTFRGGWLSAAFAVSAVLLGIWYLIAAVRFARQPDRLTARKLLRTSVIYLPLYMAALVTLACTTGRP